MKACIDARWIHPEISGIGLYTTELARALAADIHTETSRNRDAAKVRRLARMPTAGACRVDLDPVQTAAVQMHA